MRLALALCPWVYRSILFSLVVAVAARYTAECDETGTEAVSVEEHPGILGRVTVRHCGSLPVEAAQWELQLRALPVSRDACSERLAGRKPGNMHSAASEPLHHQLNCTRVCLSRSLDLVWSGCYRLYSSLISSESSSPHIRTSYHYINNSAPSAQYFTNASRHYYKQFEEGELLVVTWYTGRIPTEEYEMVVRRDDAGCQDCPWSNLTSPAPTPSVDASANCSVGGNGLTVRCSLRLTPGCYEAWLDHRAPWVAHQAYQELVSTHTYLCSSGQGPPAPLVAKAPGLGSGLVWTLVVLGSLLAVGLMAAAMWKVNRWRQGGKIQHPVDAPPLLSPSPIATGRILLLYGREPPSGMAVVSALKDLLDVVAPQQVVDLYSTQTVSTAGPAMVSWLRAVMSAPDTRVLLLQTPAVAATTAVANDDGGPIYRSPHPMDGQLSLSLRWLGEHAVPLALPYRHCFLATLSSLPTETLPHVVPFTRYSLPEAALRLLGDLTDTPLTGSNHRLHDKLKTLENAVAEFTEYVRCNENYLQDMFL